ncbi:MAG: hypothetical protein HZC41_24825 [Chloroflexi bacterium]|nr:hypothetical protein [Chloroflexota bacterium]
MHFTYYTDKTVAQCMSALNERLQQKGTASRPGLEGWVEKNGNFSMAVTTKVLKRFPRTTRLQAKAERLGSVTVIKGSVADGVTPKEQVVIVGALALVGLFIISTGNLLPGLIAIAAGVLLNIPLMGDHQNSDYLTSELQKTLKAKTTPPVAAKKALEGRRTADSKRPPQAKKPATASKPAAKKTTVPARPASPTFTPPRTGSEPLGKRVGDDL